jgi:hypothetical protein
MFLPLANKAPSVATSDASALSPASTCVPRHRAPVSHVTHPRLLIRILNLYMVFLLHENFKFDDFFQIFSKITPFHLMVVVYMLIDKS